uniref:THAP-type domain-containing protein n=1 Tax=Cuerna arida TaxID=1464854 RepID=A0A1B6FN98_9HEMI
MSRNCCSYLDCRNSAHKVKGLRMFTFPLKETLSAIWVSNCGNPVLNHYTSLELRKNKRVCELHFRREDITVTGRLKEGSIPFPYDAPLVEPDTTTSSFLAIPQWENHHQPNLPNQESKHEVFIKSEAEEVLDIYDDNTVGNFPPSIIERPDISDPASASQSLPSSKKRKFTHSPLPSGSTDIGDNTVQNIDTSKVETEFDLWARSVAHQLNHMELKRALRLQLKMQTLLSEERINQDCDSVTSVKPPSSTDGSTSNPSEGAS